MARRTLGANHASQGQKVGGPLRFLSLGPFLAAVNSAFLNISQHFTGHLFRPWIPSSARGIDGGPRRSTEVVLNEQSLPVQRNKSERKENMRQPQFCSMPGRGSSRAPLVVGLKAGVSAAKKLMKASRLRRGWLLAIMVGAMVGWSAAADPPRRAKRPPQVWAIIIGIENYTDPAIPDSQTAADHAQNIVQWFRAAGWDESPAAPASGTSAMPNPGKPEAPASSILPTRKNLKWAVDEWLRPPGRGGRPRRHLFRRPGRDRRFDGGSAVRAQGRSLPAADRRAKDRREGNRLVA